VQYHRLIIPAIAILLSLSTSGLAQESWYKDVQLQADVNVDGAHLLTTDTSIYIAGRAICYDSLDNPFNCMTLSRHDYQGAVSWETVMTWNRCANSNAISLLNDTLIVSGHSSSRARNRLFVNFFTTDGMYLKHDEINYDSLFIGDGFFNNGQVLLGRELFIQGETGNLDDVTTTVTTRYNIDTGDHVHWDLHQDPIGTPVTAGFAIRMDLDSTLLTISEMSRVGGESTDVKQITKFDREGNILAEYLGPDHDRTSSVSPHLTVLPNGNYVFTHSIDGLLDSNIPQIICLNPNTQEIEWTYDYASSQDTLREPRIAEMKTTRNGDVICCGFDSQFELHGGSSFYFVRFSPEGELLWERTFHVLDDSDEFISGGILDLSELADGSILGIGASDKNVIAMMRISADGCLTYESNEYCEKNNFLGLDTAVETLGTQAITLYPNPTQGLLNLEQLPEQWEELQVVSQTGAVLLSRKKTALQDLQLDMSAYPDGLYLLRVMDEKGLILGLQRFVKIKS